MAFMLSNDLLTAFCEAVGVDPMRCNKVILELEAGSLPMIYVTMLGTTELLEVVAPIASEAKVQIVGAE